jgi:hypothetical protein
MKAAIGAQAPAVQRSRPAPALRREAKQERIGERIAHERLERSARCPEGTAHQEREQRARRAQIPDDVGTEQIAERHGSRA